MKRLQELITILADMGIGEERLFLKERLGQNEKRITLYRNIRDGVYQTDGDAAQDLYHTTTTDTRYTVLKTRLLQQLQEHVLRVEIESPAFSEMVIAKHRAVRNVAKLKTLELMSAENNALALAHETLRLAEKYELTAVTADCLRLLKIYAAQDGNAKEYQRIKTALESIKVQLRYEEEANDYMEEIAIMFAHNKGEATEQDIRTLRGIVARINAIREQADSLEIRTYHARINCYACMAFGEYEEVVRYCEDYITWLVNLGNKYSKYRVGEFLSIALQTLTTMRNFPTAQHLAEQSMSFFFAGTSSWYQVYIHLIHTAFYSGELLHAARLTAVALQAADIKRLPARMQEMFQLYRAFSYYAITSAWIQPDAKTQSIITNDFDPLIFDADIHELSKDTTGVQLWMLIFRILYMMESGNIAGLEIYHERIRHYYYAHIHTALPRAGAFLHAIMILIEKSFAIPLILKKTAKYKNKLEAFDSKGRRVMEGLEIIPYEILWEHIILRLAELQKKGMLVHRS